MPVDRTKKCSTPNANDSTEGQSAPGLPSQQEFQQHLRDLGGMTMASPSAFLQWPLTDWSNLPERTSDKEQLAQSF
jgi:hypothetical protein